MKDLEYTSLSKEDLMPSLYDNIQCKAEKLSDCEYKYTSTTEYMGVKLKPQVVEVDFCKNEMKFK